MTTDKKARFTFRIPETTFSKLKEEADKRGVSLNALILQILWDWVKQNDDHKSA